MKRHPFPWRQDYAVEPPVIVDAANNRVPKQVLVNVGNAHAELVEALRAMVSLAHVDHLADGSELWTRTIEKACTALKRAKRCPKTNVR